MIVLGVDASLSGTGLVRFRDNMPTPTFGDVPISTHGQLGVCTVRAPRLTKGDTSAKTTSRRIAALVRDVEAAMVEDRPNLIVLEALPPGLKGSADKLMWLWGSLVDLFVRHNAPLLVVHNTAVKMFATGKGNADKDTVMLAMAKRYPQATLTNNNEADALALCMIGCRYLGQPIDTAPKDHLRCMDNGKVVLHK